MQKANEQRRGINHFFVVIIIIIMFIVDCLCSVMLTHIETFVGIKEKALVNILHFTYICTKVLNMYYIYVNVDIRPVCRYYNDQLEIKLNKRKIIIA